MWLLEVLLIFSAASSLSNADSSVDKLQSLLFRPVTPGDRYSVTVRTCHVGDAASVRVVEGACAVNGVKCDSVEASQLLSNGKLHKKNTVIEDMSSIKLANRIFLTVLSCY